MVLTDKEKLFCKHQFAHLINTTAQLARSTAKYMLSMACYDCHLRDLPGRFSMRFVRVIGIQRRVRSSDSVVICCVGFKSACIGVALHICTDLSDLSISAIYGFLPFNL